MRWHRFKKNRSALAAAALICIILTFALIGPWISGYSYQAIQLEKANLPPSSEFWFGTDDLGRDIFTRIWYGARISLFVGLSAALLDVSFGMVWGGIAAFYGGRVDSWMMRAADVLYALPYLLVVILILVIVGPGIASIILAMALLGWITMARMVRGQVLQIKQNDYIMAAEALGAAPSRILFRHILPNAAGPIIVTLTLTIPSAIFGEAFLSFLGLGVQAPIASWGTMASEGLPAMAYYPWRLFFPAGFISLTLLGFNLVGDGLRDAFDVREASL